MCTAITFHSGDHYFGRNLDLEYSYHETVTVTPRNYPFHFRKMPTLERHFAMIGMAFVQEGYPLYYEAVNEHGLGMAGLNFPGNAVYRPEAEGMDNITPFEFIPWIVGQCATVGQAREKLERLNLLDSPFSAQLPLSPLHWMISDKEESIVVESVREGLKVYDAPTGVMTNNPPYDFMGNYLTTFRDLSPDLSENRLAPAVELPVYCQGFGARGLPGDWSSPSRFVRAVFVKQNAFPGEDEGRRVGQFFHLLSAVEMPRGCVRLHPGVSDMTVYTCCVNQDTGVYYYTTYHNRRISAVDLHREDLEGSQVKSFDLFTRQDFARHN